MRAILASIGIVVQKEFKELRSKPVFVVVLPIVSLAWTANLVVVTRYLSSLGLAGTTPLVLDGLVTYQAMAMFFVFSFMIIITLYYKEKKSGTMEYLLVSPIGPTTIWLGKSLFMFLWGMAFAIAGVLFGILGVNMSLPSDAALALPGAPATFFFLVVLPILGFLVSAIMGLIHLLSSGPALSSALFLLIGMGYLGITSARIRELAVTWPVVGAYVALASVLLIAVLVGARFLTRERIILAGT